MQRGNLIIFDDNGKVWLQSGEAEGDVLPHEYPVGLPYIELPFGAMQGKTLKGVDVVSKIAILEDIPHIETEAEKLMREKEELENQILLMAENDIGGIL
jgi:hypothetical protein